MRMLRCLIDSMIFDAIAAEPEVAALVDRLTSARRLELLAAAASLEQVAAAPDPAHRRRLQRVRVLAVAPIDDDAPPPVRALLADLGRCTGVGREDAMIAATAAAQRVPLVTEDRDLRAAAAVNLPHLPLWSWGADLRPRLVALGAAPSASARSRRR